MPISNAPVRVLLWMTAAAMLVRMALNPRIFHYGFVQAALAGVVGAAILMSSIPKFLKVDAVATRWYQALITLLIVAVIGVATPTGLLVEKARQYLEKDIIDNSVHSLLVLPEGVMLNYLTRLPNSISYFFFAPFVLADGRNAEIIHQLNAAPPDRIVVISRDMREFGVAQFGESPEHGADLLAFISANYKGVYAFGDPDPANPDQFGVMIFARKP